MMTNFALLAQQAARIATGVLGWTPSEFWSATPVELITALEGRFGNSCDLQPMLARELAALREKMGDG
jgi:hypothetical protein